MPVFDDLVVDPDGWVWVRRYNLPWEDTVSIMDVHDTSGKWQGTVKLPSSPARPYLLDIGRDYVLLLMIGDLDIPHIVKYRLLKE